MGTSVLQDLLKDHSSEIGNWSEIVSNHQESAETAESFRTRAAPYNIEHDGPFYIFVSQLHFAMSQNQRGPRNVLRECQESVYEFFGGSENLFHVNLFIPLVRGCCMLRAKDFGSCVRILRKDGENFKEKPIKVEYVVPDVDMPSKYTAFTSVQLDAQQEMYEHARQQSQQIQAEEKGPKPPKPNPFGDAKPADTSKKMEEIELKIRAKELEQKKEAIEAVVHQNNNNNNKNNNGNPAQQQIVGIASREGGGNEVVAAHVNVTTTASGGGPKYMRGSEKEEGRDGRVVGNFIRQAVTQRQPPTKTTSEPKYQSKGTSHFYSPPVTAGNPIAVQSLSRHQIGEKHSHNPHLQHQPFGGSSSSATHQNPHPHRKIFLNRTHNRPFEQQGTAGFGERGVAGGREMGLKVAENGPSDNANRNNARADDIGSSKQTTATNASVSTCSQNSTELGTAQAAAVKTENKGGEKKQKKRNKPQQNKGGKNENNIVSTNKFQELWGQTL